MLEFARNLSDGVGVNLILPMKNQVTRRAYRDSDYSTIRAITRPFYATKEAAEEAMEGNEVAFRVNHVESVNKWQIAILGTYFLLHRTVKSKPWAKVAETLGSCKADAIAQWPEEEAQWPLFQVVSDTEFITIQTKQHLRQLGIKAA